MLPAAMSAGVSVYVVTGLFTSPNCAAPLPPLQVTDDADPKTVAFNETTWSSQTSRSTPASTLADSLIVIVTSSNTGAHGPEPSGSLDVNLNVTTPPTSDGSGM